MAGAERGYVIISTCFLVTKGICVNNKTSGRCPTRNAQHPASGRAVLNRDWQLSLTHFTRGNRVAARPHRASRSPRTFAPRWVARLVPSPPGPSRRLLFSFYLSFSLSRRPCAGTVQTTLLGIKSLSRRRLINDERRVTTLRRWYTRMCAHMHKPTVTNW